jgi:hypothetical protein
MGAGALLFRELDPQSSRVPETCGKGSVILRNLFSRPKAEFDQLRDNVIKERGCRDPMVVWNGRGVLLDGHHRYEILCEDPSLSYSIIERDFPDLTDAKIWIIRNQFGRRNLSPYQRGELALALKPLVAAKAKNQQGTRTDIPQNSAECFTPIETREEIARKADLFHVVQLPIAPPDLLPRRDMMDQPSTGLRTPHRYPCTKPEARPRRNLNRENGTITCAHCGQLLHRVFFWGMKVPLMEKRPYWTWGRPR